MNNERTIKLLEKVLEKSSKIKIELSTDPTFKSWKNSTERTLIKVFGVESFEVKEFKKLNFHYNPLIVDVYSDYSEDDLKHFRNDFETTKKNIENYIEDLKDDMFDDSIETGYSTKELENIFKKFHNIARQLLIRRENRHSLKINDEYDVQDLLHSLLRLYFDDVRPEEWTPSYAGSSSRMDFLLKEIKTVIEVKKTRETLKDKELGEQLIIDIEKYAEHTDCETLYCFVYDPEGIILNPRGLENDLSRNECINVKVFITPKF